MWQMWERLETLRRTLSCLLHPPAFGSGSVWFQDEILRAAVEPYAGAASSGLLLVHHNAQPYVAGVSLQFLDGALDAFKQKIHRSWITYSHFPPWWFWTQSSDCKWFDFPLIVYFVAYFIRDVFPLVLSGVPKLSSPSFLCQVITSCVCVRTLFPNLLFYMCLMCLLWLWQFVWLLFGFALTACTDFCVLTSGIN